MQIFGHRGAAGLAAENTIASIRKGLDWNVDGVEFDVRCSRDRVPVVIHDATVDRTTDGSGFVHELMLSQLQRLAVEHSGRIPTLEQVVTEVAGRVRLNVELKEQNSAQPAASVLGKAIVASTVAAERLLVSSFELEAIEEFRKIHDRIPVALLTRGLPSGSFWLNAKRLRAVAANIDLESVTGTFVHRAHAEGLQVMVYTVNDREDAHRMRELGVDAIFSDYPNRFATAWDRHT